jgi:hypothetical protein
MMAANAGTPTPGSVASWASDYGVSHPVLADPGQINAPFVQMGYPTFVVADRGMVIQNADMWPWSESYLTSLF